jgi:hypothetical protein
MHRHVNQLTACRMCRKRLGDIFAVAGRSGAQLFSGARQEHPTHMRHACARLFESERVARCSDTSQPLCWWPACPESGGALNG